MDFHKAKIFPEAIEAAVDLSVRHQSDRKLPDKAIDLIDSACARQRFLGHKNFKIRKHNIIEELSKATRIPIEHLNSEETKSLAEIDVHIKTKLYGQDQVIDTVVNKIMVSKAGLKSINKPIGTFLLLGPTGSGKTEFAKLLAEYSQAKLLRFDMSEYQEKHTVARLIGAPPGYVGYEDGNLGGGMLVSEIEKNPHSIILFDEIEKAHPDVSNVLLQLMDEGFITSTNGKKADARNTVILMTSNLGAKDNEMNNIGFSQELEKSGEEDKAMKNFFKPEFRNRLDGVCKFKHLSNEVVRKIVGKFKDEINDLLAEKGIKIEFMEKAVAQLAELGFSKKMGARPLSRVIEDKVKIPLSKKILFEKIPEGSLITIDHVDEQFKITVNTGKVELEDEKLHTENNAGIDKSGLIVLDQFKPEPK
jgi:ATP-dependent Clp protease ATP-binding subunit ClpA